MIKQLFLHRNMTHCQHKVGRTHSVHVLTDNKKGKWQRQSCHAKPIKLAALIFQMTLSQMHMEYKDRAKQLSYSTISHEPHCPLHWNTTVFLYILIQFSSFYVQFTCLCLRNQHELIYLPEVEVGSAGIVSLVPFWLLGIFSVLLLGFYLAI